MREIKFRMWHKGYPNENGELAESKIEGHAGVTPHMKYVDWLPSDRGDYEIWMQYTGLKDKNGKEIYEGDVVSMFQGSQKSEVFYKNGAFYVIAQISGGYPDMEHLLCNITDTAEVIGNTLENPDLLSNQNK